MKRLLLYVALAVSRKLRVHPLAPDRSFQSATRPDASRVALFAVLVNLVPFAALILMWMHRPKTGAWLLIFILGLGFAIGTYTHLLRPRSDNVFQMAPGEWAWPFRLTATLLLLIEASGCWLGVKVLRLQNRFSNAS